MKGIIMDKYDDKIIVMTSNGQFLEKRIPRNEVEIGQEIEINNGNSAIYRKIISMAAAIIIFITGGYGVYGYYNPFGYINIDINPSVELSYNLYGRIISIKGLNEDGQFIVSKINGYKHKPIDDAINLIIDEAIEEKYVKANEENVILLTITEEGKKINDEGIYEQINNHIAETKTDAEVILIEGDDKTFKIAKNENISPGKKLLASKAFEANSTLSLEEIESKSVKEIMGIIKDARKEEKNNNNNNKNDDSNKRNNDEDKNNDEDDDNDEDDYDDDDRKDKNNNDNGNKGNTKNAGKGNGNNNIIKDKSDNDEDEDDKGEDEENYEEDDKKDNKEHEKDNKEQDNGNEKNGKNGKNDNQGKGNNSKNSRDSDDDDEDDDDEDNDEDDDDDD